MSRQRNFACMAQIATVPSPSWNPRVPFVAPSAAPRLAPTSIEAACFEVHPDAQIVVSAQCETLAANRAARSLLTAAEGPRGLADRIARGSGPQPRAAREQILAAIRMQLPTEEFVLSVNSALTLSVRGVPLGPTFERALLIVRRHDEGGVRAVCERLDFTRTETDVAEYLARGFSIPRIGAQLGITIDTVRCHLKQAFAKAGVHRQAELVVLLLSH